LQCEETEKYLFEFAEGSLTELQRKSVDQHIQQCDACSRLLHDIWETSLQSVNWQEVTVPRWDKRSLFFGTSRARPDSSPLGRFSFPWLNLVSVTASALVLVVVLFRVEVLTNENGFSVSFAGQNNLVSTEELDRRLSSVQQDNQRSFNTNVDRLTTQQVATNQLLLRTILEANRQERREDLSNMMVLWDSDRQRRSQMTDESLRYLIRNQAEDKLELRDLSLAVRSFNNQQDDNL